MCLLVSIPRIVQNAMLLNIIPYKAVYLLYIQKIDQKSGKLIL